MMTFGKTLLATGVATLLAAPLASAQPTPAEFKCEAATSKNGAKFISAKAKCVDKCLSNFWKGLGPESDCLPPYGGPTAFCIFDSLKGAEGKYAMAIKKACDPATKPTNECPDCYSGGDCTDAGHAGNQVQSLEGQLDSFVPGVACERAGADANEQKCQRAAAKALSKQVGTIVKCYDKCKSNEFKGLVASGSCNPPASDPATQTCVANGNAKTIAAIDKVCSPVAPAPIARPDCPGPDQYPTGAAWVNLVDLSISGNIPTTYCE